MGRYTVCHMKFTLMNMVYEDVTDRNLTESEKFDAFHAARKQLKTCKGMKELYLSLKPQSEVMQAE